MKDSKIVAMFVAQTEAILQDRIHQRVISPQVVAEFGMIPDAEFPDKIEQAVTWAIDYIDGSYDGDIPKWFKKKWISSEW